jgi:multidrug efflux pump subunit AcrA (membrane-fusion protein)
MHKGVIVIAAFIMGWLASFTVTALSAPAPILEQAQETIALFENPNDVPSPYDSVSDSRIHVLPNRIEIDVAGAIPAKFTDTNSMDPVIDTEATAIEVSITDESQVHVGDIVSYVTPLAPGSTVVHRVVEIGTDEDGWFVITKGDNLGTTDPAKVRLSQLRRKVIGIIY